MQIIWFRNQSMHIAEARRLTSTANGDFNKPVFFFTSQKFDTAFTSDVPRGTNLPPEIWRQLLALGTNEADGMVIWGGTQAWQPITEDPETNWWDVTQDFVNETSAVPATPSVTFSSQGAKLTWADVANEDG